MSDFSVLDHFLNRTYERSSVQNLVISSTSAHSGRFWSHTRRTNFVCDCDYRRAHYIMGYAISIASDQPTHLRSLIRAETVRHVVNESLACCYGRYRSRSIAMGDGQQTKTQITFCMMWHTVNADTLDHFCSVESISYAINALIRFYKLNNLFVSVARVTYYKCAKMTFYLK